MICTIPICCLSYAVWMCLICCNRINEAYICRLFYLNGDQNFQLKGKLISYAFIDKFNGHLLIISVFVAIHISVFLFISILISVSIFIFLVIYPWVSSFLSQSLVFLFRPFYAFPFTIFVIQLLTFPSLISFIFVYVSHFSSVKTSFFTFISIFLFIIVLLYKFTFLWLFIILLLLLIWFLTIF